MESTHLQTRRSQRSGVNSLYKSTLVPSPSISFTSATSPAGIALSTPTRLSNDNAVNTIDETNNIIVKLMERLDAAEVVMSNNNEYVKKLEFRIHHLEQCIIYKKKETNVCENKNVVVSKQPIKKHKESTAAKSFFDIPLENRFESLTRHEEDETTTDEPITDELVGIDFNIGTPITTKGRDVNKTNKKLYSQTLNTANLVKPPQPKSPKQNSNKASPDKQIVQNYTDYPLQPVVRRRNKNNGKKKIFVVGDSHVKRLNKDIMTYWLDDQNSTLKTKSFEGANTKRIKHHILPSLHEEQPDKVIIHAGTNDISPNTIHIVRPFDLAEQILNVGKVCKSFGVDDIFISSILPRKDVECKQLILEVNDALKNMCNFNGFKFISNNNINDSFLHGDDIHLNSVGSHLLATNFTEHLKSV